eukprot:XP_765341.1 hypothetical protein [Theileria parva strain Muguga]
MICENCDEEIGDAVTCPICGVIQNITETQVDVFSGFYSKSQKISQPAPLQVDTIPISSQIGLTTDTADTLDTKIKVRICELQELLKNITKILVIKYNVTYRVEVYAKNLWKSFLTRFITNLNSCQDVNVNSPHNSGKPLDEPVNVKSLDERLVVEIICKSLNKLPYINFKKNPNSQSNRLDYLLEDSSGLNDSKVDILCRKIMKYLRLPSICLIVLDKLVGCVLEAEFNLSDEILSCALVLIVCRLLWPIFHIQPPAHNTATKSTVDNTSSKSAVERVNIQNVKDDVINESDNRILKYVLEKYREKDMNSFMSSILYRYTSNYYLQFKLSSLKHLFKSHNTTLNLLGFKLPNTSSENAIAEDSDDGVDELIHKLKRGLMSNNEIYYVITSLFRNYPNYSGFSLEKLLEFTHFTFTNHDQKRQTFKSLKKILNTNQYNIYNSINLSTLLNKDNSEMSQNTVNSGVKTNLYEFELNRINNLMGHMDTVTEIGYTLPNKPYKLKNKSYSGLPVIYILTLKVVSNYAGVSQYKVHENVVSIEQFLIDKFN